MISAVINITVGIILIRTIAYGIWEIRRKNLFGGGVVFVEVCVAVLLLIRHIINY